MTPEKAQQELQFQSTPSVGRATFSPRQPRHNGSISIHALRGEGDDRHTGLRTYPYHFNPRPPWGGRRQKVCEIRYNSAISIHALRGEGDGEATRALIQTNISIHALRGEGDICICSFLFDCCISIHALRGEGDLSASWRSTTNNRFQSTPSVGRATIEWRSTATEEQISIHALRGEGDYLQNSFL